MQATDRADEKMTLQLPQSSKFELKSESSMDAIMAAYKQDRQ